MAGYARAHGCLATGVGAGVGSPIISNHLLPFIGISIVLALAPGPDFALVTRNALALGHRGTVLTTAGLASALLVWVGATSLGVVALLRASPALYTVIKDCGGAYLGYLGARTLWTGRHGASKVVPETSAIAGRAFGLWRQGFLSALLNPKLGVFFVTFFPQFIDRNQPTAPQVALLGSIFIVIGIGWMTLYGLAVSRLRATLMSARVRVWLERASGVALLGFGAALIVQLAQ